MRTASLICLLFLLSYCVSAQDTLYTIRLAKASLLHLQKNYKAAIDQYEKAFASHQPDALNAYKAAAVYALDSNADKALHYLQLAIAAGYTEADWLMADPYFQYIKEQYPQQWAQVSNLSEQGEKRFEQTLKRPALRKRIIGMALNDQRLRYQRAQATSKPERAEIDQQIFFSDKANLELAKSIIRQYGWPRMDHIGRDGQNNLWLMVQHADGDVLFQQEALDAMKKLLGTAQLNFENYAFLYDRVQCNLNHFQKYGTQVVWTHSGEASGFRRIEKEDKADELRASVGMEPLYVYALTYGFNYNKPSRAQAKANDSLDLAKARRLMDSGRYYYRQRQFQKTYDFYNEASTIAGGMSTKDNYEAAVLFAKIAAEDSNEQYASIALDFLHLIYLRRELSKKKALGEPAFKPLHELPRWKEMIP